MKSYISLGRTLKNEIQREINHVRVRAMDSLGFLTYRCTSRCKTCNIWQKNADENTKGELSKGDWLKVLSKLKDYGIRSFEIFGGDALLRKDAIYDIIEFCNKNGIVTYLPTNANLCDRETIRKFIDSGLNMLYLSVDGIDDEHDNIRGVDGTFKRIKTTLSTFIEEKNRKGSCYPKINIVTTLSNMNYNKFSNLIKYFENYQINCIYPRNLVEFSKGNIENSNINGYTPDPYYVPSDSGSHLFTREELGEFKRIVKTVKRTRRNIRVDFRDIDMAKDDTFLRGVYDFKKCHVATMLVTINPNGDVVPCPFYNSYVIGNLLRNNLEEIWGNSMHREFIRYQQAKKLALCQNCNLPVYHPSIYDTLKYYSIRLAEKIA